MRRTSYWTDTPTATLTMNKTLRRCRPLKGALLRPIWLAETVWSAEAGGVPVLLLEVACPTSFKAMIWKTTTSMVVFLRA